MSSQGTRRALARAAIQNHRGGGKFPREGSRRSDDEQEPRGRRLARRHRRSLWSVGRVARNARCKATGRKKAWLRLCDHGIAWAESRRWFGGQALSDRTKL